MQINVAQLLKGAVGGIRNYQINEVVDFTEGGNGKVIQGEINLLRTQRGVLVQGQLQTEVELTCSRCLRLFRKAVELSLEEEYLPTRDIVSGVSLSSPEDPDSFLIDEHHVIDLAEAVRQYVLLAIPMKPLCQEDCAGLCPICGKNLNEGPCDCPERLLDPHWAELIKLL